MSPALGKLAFLIAFAMMIGEVGKDIVSLHDWHEAAQPVFIGNIFIHFGSVTIAFFGGKLVPSDPMVNGSRKSDPKG